MSDQQEPCMKACRECAERRSMSLCAKGAGHAGQCQCHDCSRCRSECLECGDRCVFAASHGLRHVCGRCFAVAHEPRCIGNAKECQVVFASARRVAQAWHDGVEPTTEQRRALMNAVGIG